MKIEKDTVDDIKEILQYNWEDELDDFIDSGSDENHVFCTLVRIDNAIYKTKHTPEYWKRK